MMAQLQGDDLLFALGDLLLGARRAVVAAGLAGLICRLIHVSLDPMVTKRPRLTQGGLRSLRVKVSGETITAQVPGDVSNLGEGGIGLDANFHILRLRTVWCWCEFKAGFKMGFRSG